MSSHIQVVLTGGGTAGHVMPNLAILPLLQQRGTEVLYIGSRGIEQDLVQRAGIEFIPIAAGKLRRYFSLQNFTDIFRIFLGFGQALFILARRRPQVVFSKGGFVTVPVVFAARLLGVKVVIHESDFSAGLATRLAMPLADKVICSFPETLKHLPPGKSFCLGNPIRRELLSGDKQKALDLCGFKAGDTRPVVLVMGGSQGAQRINEALQGCLPHLLKSFRVVHLAGKGKLLPVHEDGYCGFEFVHDEMRDLLALCDYVVSRAGANSLFELAALAKPMLLIPLQVGSRGDQVLNAESFARQGWAMVVEETTLTPEILQQQIEELKRRSAELRENLQRSSLRDTSEKVVELILA